MGEAKSELKEKLRWFARLGYTAKGSIYMVIGGLAIMLAIGSGGETTDTQGAIQMIANQPYGNILLILLISGLFGYAAWQLALSLFDADNQGTSAKGLAVRIGRFGSALVHIALAAWTLKILIAPGRGSGSSGKTMAEQYLGNYGLMGLGCLVIILGLVYIYRGWTARFEKHMTIPRSVRSWLKPLCKFGVISRGIVWCIIGGIVIRSVWLTSRGDVKGVEEALNTMASSQFGGLLLFIVAAGLFAYGLYNLAQAKYRRIDFGS